MENKPQLIRPQQSTLPSNSATSKLIEHRNWIKEELRLLAVRSQQTISRECVDLTIDDLVGFSQEDLRRAFTAARKECKFFPKLAELLEFIKRDNVERSLGRPQFSCRVEQEQRPLFIIINTEDETQAWAGNHWTDRKYSGTELIRFADRGEAEEYIQRRFIPPPAKEQESA